MALGLSSLLASGCSLDPLSGHITTPAPGMPTYQPVSPNAYSVRGEDSNVTLYFGFQDTGLLATEQRKIESGVNTRPERGLIEALIAGPDAEHPELTPLLPAKLRVLGAEERDGILFITLSNEFMSLPGGAPAEWQNDEYWSRELPRRRRLALQSIVCAVTDLGQYDGVQLLIDPDNEGDRPGERVQRCNFYADAANDARLMLDVTKRDESMVLTPRNTLKQALLCLQSRNWDELYKYIESQGEAVPRPPRDKFIADMQARSFALADYAVGDAMVTGDGQGATVCLNARLTLGGGTSCDITTFPLKLRREGGVWKLAYPSLMAFLEVCLR